MKRHSSSRRKANRKRSPITISQRQRWTFRAIALLTPLLLLAVLEIFLRASGYGYPTAFFLKERVNGREVLTDNWRFGWRFFPKQIARTPQPVMFSPHKLPGTTRIFVFGESAAMGDPEPSFGLPRMLQAMLELKFPSNKFEVINVAMTAINSHVIREIAKDCAPLEGDIWIIYMGNNEVVGPFGCGTIFGRQTPSRNFIRATLWLKQFRIVQLLAAFGERGPAEWGGMEMFLKQQVRRDDSRMKTVDAHFRENLSDIVRLGREAGAKVLVDTVAVNQKDCPPFASQHSSLTRTETLKFEKHFEDGLSLERSNQFAAAHAAFSQAPRSTSTTGKDDSFAELYFHLARCELTLGSNYAARLHFNLAKECDTLRFRADDAINDIIREQTNSADARFLLVDTASEVAKRSRDGIPGADLFYDHVHFTFKGNYQLARAFFDEVMRMLPPQMTNQFVAAFPTMKDCARRLAWTDWNRLEVFEEVRKRLEQPPFSAQFGHAAADAEWKQRIEELGASLTPEKFERTKDDYIAALRLAPEDWVLRENFAKFLEANSESTLALEQWREVTRLLPQDIQSRYHIGDLLDSMGRSEEALPFFHAALQKNPALVEARNGLALALANLGRTAEAEHELQTVLRLKSKATEARVNLGHVLAQQGKTNEAIAQYEFVLNNDTNSAAAHVNLGKLLNQRGERAAAARHYEAALRINPRNAVAHYNLGNALLATDSAAAMQHYAEAVRTKPDFAEAHLALALELTRAGNMAEAQSHFAEAVRLQPQSPETHFNYGVLLAKQGRFTEAAKEFSETLRLQPSHPQAREFLQRAERMK